jgi:dGTPase
VHPLAPNDHVHTRLTHSLEVGQVGRDLGKALWSHIKKELPPDISAHDLGNIVQCACLAHDIGNPAFGHAGESAMSHWFELKGPDLFRSMAKEHKRDVSTFEGNAQGFRMITQTENHLFSGGLRLTYATLGAGLKYPWSSRKPGQKFGAFITEEKILEQVAHELGLVSRGKHEWCRHPLAFLVEAADDICYAVIDLEDGVELGIVTFEEVADLLLKDFGPKERGRIEKTFESKEAYRVNLARLRGPVFDLVIGSAINGFMKRYDGIMRGDPCGDVFGLLPTSDVGRGIVERSKKFAAERIYGDQKKVEIEIGCYSTFECLLEAFCEAALACAQNLASHKGEVTLGGKSKLILRLLGDHTPSEGNAPRGYRWTEYQCLRRVLDFVSGMTDAYATYVAKQLHGTGFSGVQRP